MEILRGFFNYEFDVKGDNGEDIGGIYREAAVAFTRTELRGLGYRLDAINALFDNHEAFEDTPISDDYCHLLTVFNRKVLTATSSLI
jgi:hypothetical protein